MTDRAPYKLPVKIGGEIKSFAFRSEQSLLEFLIDNKLDYVLDECHPCHYKDTHGRDGGSQRLCTAMGRDCPRYAKLAWEMYGVLQETPEPRDDEIHDRPLKPTEYMWVPEHLRFTLVSCQFCWRGDKYWYFGSKKIKCKYHDCEVQPNQRCGHWFLTGDENPYDNP